MLQGQQEILVDALLFLAGLMLEHRALHVRIVLLRIGRRNFHAPDAEFEDVERRGIGLIDLGEGTEFLRQIEHESRLDEVRLDLLGEDLVRDLEILPLRLDLQSELLGRGDMVGLGPAENQSGSPVSARIRSL